MPVRPSPVTRRSPSGLPVFGPAWQGALWFFALCLLVVVFFWRHVFTGLIFGHGDTFLLFYPAWDYRAAALRAGRIPLWNPITFMGAPFLANSQYGVLYPPNWPLAWLPAPAAVEIAILSHLILAACGAQLFARQTLKLRPFSAWFAAFLFALGGYLTTHVELVNQLQGLAWLPWIFWAADRARHQPRRFVPLLSLFIALQLLAGHAQTTFITLVGAMILAVASGLLAHRRLSNARRLTSSAIRQSLIRNALFLLPLSFLLACLLSAAQLLPTLELSRHSLRAGGLSANEAVSFSLDPRLLGRSLLPGYSRPLFGEYVGTVGVTALGLAVVSLSRAGAAASETRDLRLAVLAVAGVGVFFALGRFNPLYAALVHYVPGFSFFRVPARWLALWGFGGAMCAGTGLELLMDEESRPAWQWTIMAVLAIAGLIGLTYASSGITPAGETGPLPLPAPKDAALWLAAAVGALAAIGLRRPGRLRGAILAGLAGFELFAASRVQPFNQLTTPIAYYGRRPALDFLLAAQTGSNPPGRTLAASRLFYDPTLEGVRLSEIPLPQPLPSAAVHDYLTATKYKDVLSHNLGLTWNIPTLDGYDGGILPLRNYLTFEEYLLGHRPVTFDGRLRENLLQTPGEPPAGRALSLANAQFYIADKTFDAWIDGIYYDFTHHATLAAGQEATVAAVPDVAGTALGVVSFLNGAQRVRDGTPVADIALTFADGQRHTFTLRAGEETAEGIYAAGAIAHRQAPVAGNFWPDRPEISDYLARLRWPEVRRVRTITVRGLAPPGEIVIRGLTLIDETSGSYAPLVISSTGRYRLVYSGDVKVYENLDNLPRAFIVGQAEVIPNDASALARMRAPDFSPARTVVLADGAALSDARQGTRGTAAVTGYAPERVAIEADLTAPGVLVLADAYYPGWVAAVDGLPAPIHRADLLFRGVPLPAGHHTIVFRFESRPFRIGAWISLLALGAWGMWWVIFQRSRKSAGKR